MASIEVINENNKKVEDVSIADKIMTDKVNKAVLYQAIHHHQASQHHGTVKTQDRTEVSRTTKKVYRQKGTGGARHGSRRPAPFVGGGRVFGPRPRDYSYKLNKKVRSLAVKEALRYQLQEGNIKVVKEISFAEIKTKNAIEFFKGIEVSRGLVVLDKPSEIIEKSVRNLVGFKVVRAAQLKVFDILKAPTLIFTAQAFNQVSERFLTEAS